MEFSQTVIYAFQRKKQQDVSLNTFILGLVKLNINELDLDMQIDDNRRNSILHMLNLTPFRVMIYKLFSFLKFLSLRS